MYPDTGQGYWQKQFWPLSWDTARARVFLQFSCRTCYPSWPRWAADQPSMLEWWEKALWSTGRPPMCLQAAWMKTQSLREKDQRKASPWEGTIRNCLSLQSLTPHSSQARCSTALSGQQSTPHTFPTAPFPQQILLSRELKNDPLEAAGKLL